MISTTSFVDPVVINGKTFEKSDVKPTCNALLRVVEAAGHKPAPAKKSAARFIVAAAELGLYRLSREKLSHYQQLAR